MLFKPFSICTVKGVWTFGVGSNWSAYGTQLTTQFDDRDGPSTYDALLCCLTIYRVLWRVGRRPELLRLTSVQRLTVPTIREFSSISALHALEVMCSLFWQFLSNRSQYVVVNGCQSNLVKVVSGVLQGFVLGHCSSSTPWSFSLYKRTSWMVTLMTPLWLLCQVRSPIE